MFKLFEKLYFEKDIYIMNTKKICNKDTNYKLKFGGTEYCIPNFTNSIDKATLLNSEGISANNPRNSNIEIWKNN